MMIPEFDDLEIFGVYDRSVPNSERIVLRANRSVNLVNYLLILGVRGQLGAEVVLPIPDNCLWLGDTIVEIPSWIFIYTGVGKRSISQEINTKEPVHCLYWNKPAVVFIHDDILPALIHVDNVQIGNKPNKSVLDVKTKAETESLVSFADILRLANSHQSK